MKRAFSKPIRIAMALLVALALPLIVVASSVDESIVDATAPTGSVRLAPGASGVITINLTVNGNQEGTATFKVNRDWTLSGGAFAGSNPETFTVSPRAAQDPATTFTTSGTVAVASGQAAGEFVLAVGAFDITNSNSTGAKLGAGKSSNYTVTVASPSDDTPPVITPSVTGTPGNNGWYVSDVTVTWAVADPESTVTSKSGCDSTTISTDTAGTTLTCTATSAGGTSSKSVTIKRDATAPTISASATKADSSTYSAGTWTNQTVTVHYTCGDTGGSGLAGACPDDAVYGTDGTYTASGTVTDNAGNSAEATLGPVKIDKTEPSVTCGPADGNWHSDNVSITCTAADGGSGLASTSDSSFTLSTSVSSGTETSDAFTGYHDVYDLAGNKTTAGPIGGNKVDRKAPQLAGCESADGNWHATDVTLKCTYTDGGSGPANQYVSLVTNVSADVETPNASASAGGKQACDAVSNCAASPADIAGNKVDKKAPVISGIALTPPGPYLVGQSVTITYKVSDDGSGVKDSTPPSGSTFKASIGDNSVTVVAKDYVGNSTTSSAAKYTAYGFKLLYDPAKAAKQGSTIPLKIQLVDGNGANMSDPSIVVKAVGFTYEGSVTTDEVLDSGNANPDSNFRYDAVLDGYIYNLSTKNLKSGQYALKIALGDASASVVSPVVFQVK